MLDSDSLPQSIQQAIERFEPVMASRRVELRFRPHFVKWVMRFDQFRKQSLRRSFLTCGDADVVQFLRDQRARFSISHWLDFPLAGAAGSGSDRSFPAERHESAGC